MAGYVTQAVFAEFLVDEFKNLFNPRRDNADEFRFGNLLDGAVVFLADRIDVDGFFLVGLS